MNTSIVRARSLRNILGISVAAAFLSVASLIPSSASAQSRVAGAGISKVGRDTRKLTVSASGSGASSSGTVQFIHNSPAGLTRFRGTVGCVSVSGSTVQVTGTIDKGETATGALLDGKSFGFTINTGAPQSFSLPNLGDAGAIAACSGGRSETVPVTEDGFKLQ